MHLRVLAACVWLFWSEGVFAWAQCPTPHLTPLLSYGRWSADAERVTEHQVEAKNENYEFQAAEFSSDPLFTVSILSSAAGTYRAAVARSREPLPTTKPSDVVVRYRDLSPVRARRLLEATKQVLLSTRYPQEPCGADWLDGYYMQFMMNTDSSTYGTLAGEVYSPDEGTEAFALVELVRALRAYVVDDADPEELMEALIRLEKHK